MKQKDFYKAIRLTFWIMVGLSLLMPFVVVGTILSFTGGIWQLGILFAVITFADFIAIPIGWSVFYPAVAGKKQVYRMIKEENVVNVTQIARTVGIDYTTENNLFYKIRKHSEEEKLNTARKEVIDKIRYLISHGYLYKWTFDNNYEYLIRPETEEIKVQFGKCPNCGAKLTPDTKKCEYCGFIVKG
jgi:CYTH domain-containing protein